MAFKEWFSANWKNVLIIMFAVLWVSKCTSGCSKSTTIKHQKAAIAVLDSTLAVRDSAIHDMEFEIASLNGSLVSERSHNDNFTAIASGNQKELLNKINELDNANTVLKRENESLKKTVSVLEAEAVLTKKELEEIKNK